MNATNETAMLKRRIKALAGANTRLIRDNRKLRKALGTLTAAAGPVLAGLPDGSLLTEPLGNAILLAQKTLEDTSR